MTRDAREPVRVPPVCRKSCGGLVKRGVASGWTMSRKAGCAGTGGCRAHSRYTQREEARPFEPHGRGRGYEDAALLTSTQQGDAGTCRGRPNRKPRATPAVTRDQVGDIPTWPKVCSLLGGPAPFHSHDLAEPRTTSHSYPKEQGPCSEWGI